MKASQVANTLGLTTAYEKAVREIGENHQCNQGCGEGWCARNEDVHQQKLVELMKPK